MAVASEIHQSHPETVKRLNRVQGHLRSVVNMIEEGRPCIDIAQQLHAIEKAVAQAKKTWYTTTSTTAWITQSVMTLAKGEVRWRSSRPSASICSEVLRDRKSSRLARFRLAMGWS